MNTLSQQPKNFSLEEQEDIIKNYSKENGWEVLSVYQEVTDYSSSSNQPKLTEIIADSSNKEFDALVVPRLDRLTRNIRILNTLISEVCMKNGVALISIEEGLDTRSESGEQVLRIIDIITKWDTKRISDRTREIIARKRAKGERVGHAPFGFTYRNKRLVEVDSELKIVAVIREERDKGNSYHKIAKFLNEGKIPSKRGGIWYAETVKTVYQNALYEKHHADEPAPSESQAS